VTGRCSPHLCDVSHGEGVWLIDEVERRYLDGSPAAVVASLGHGNIGIAAALSCEWPCECG
jgi:adenosylmethionine-8-amino-7-oxononanoate aminotransferase